jgi:antitoxin component of MazEF toxin-antitoxin module
MELRRPVKLRVQKAKSGKATIYVVTLPKDFVEALGWEKGDQLEAVLDTEKQEIRIRKIA